MPTLIVTPNPAPEAGAIVNIAGSGFVSTRKTRLYLNGSPITGQFRPVSGAFSFAKPIGATTPQTLTAQQCVIRTWTTVATAIITIEAPAIPPDPPPDPDPAPGGVEPAYADMPGWRLVFRDDFDDRTIAEGHFMDGSPDAYHTADGRYVVFKNGWQDTSRHGRYSQKYISVHDGMLDIHIQTTTEADGTFPRVATLTALPSGGSAKGGLLGMRRHIRARGDLMVGYKGVPLLWADAASTNDMLMLYGEIDWPESNTNGPVHGFMHRTGASSLSDQYVFIPSPDTVSWQDWHDYVIEWIAGVSCKVFVDGVQVGATQTSRVPNTPMHSNSQFETSLGGAPTPSPSVSGHFQIDRMGIWVPV